LFFSFSIIKETGGGQNFCILFSSVVDPDSLNPNPDPEFQVIKKNCLLTFLYFCGSFVLLDPDPDWIQIYNTACSQCFGDVADRFLYLYLKLCILFSGEAALRRQAALPGAHGHEHCAQDDGRVDG
jgi:hypothetical protein